MTNAMTNKHDRTVRLVLTACLSLLCAQALPAQEFSLEIGSPVAAANFRAKMAVFAVRSKGCSEPAKAEVSGTAEGLVNGERRAVPLLHILAMPTPGVFTVSQEWGPEGAWVVNLTARCDEAKAGALVPIGPKGFLRESAKFYPRAAEKQEIETALKTLVETLHEQTEPRR
jgi:hypothetical protein